MIEFRDKVETFIDGLERFLYGVCRLILHVLFILAIYHILKLVRIIYTWFNTSPEPESYQVTRSQYFGEL